jgi:hypothetical protein
MATMDVGAMPYLVWPIGYCDGCSVWGQRTPIVFPNEYLSCLCQICQDYVQECRDNGDQQGVLCILEGRLPPGWHAALAEEGVPPLRNDGLKGNGKGKEVHEADKAGGRGKAEGKGRDRSRSPRRHAA